MGVVVIVVVIVWKVAGLFATKNIRSREIKFHGSFVPLNFRSLELSLS